MLKKTCINLSFKDSPNDKDKSKKKEDSNTEDTPKNAKNSWSGYHVKFRNPRNYHEFAIDEKFNRWGDMVKFFENQERPYKLSQGSLKDLLYGTYKRKGMHSLSLNDLVSITKIERDKINKSKSANSQSVNSLNKDEDSNEENPVPVFEDQGTGQLLMAL